MRAWGSRYAHLVLERCGGNKRKTCRALGISYHTLQAYLKYQPVAATETDAEGVAGEELKTAIDESIDAIETAAPE